MNDIDTSFFNRIITDLKLQSDLSACLDDFNEILDSFELQNNLVYSKEDGGAIPPEIQNQAQPQQQQQQPATQVNQQGLVNPQTKEDKKAIANVRAQSKQDTTSGQGTGSIGSIVKGTAKFLFNIAGWFFRTLKSIVKFALTGFKGNMFTAKNRINKFGNKLHVMQDCKVKGFTASQIISLLKRLDEHDVNIDLKLDPGKIASARKEFITKFNSKMSKEAQIDNNFKPVLVPQLRTVTIRELGYGTTEAMMNTIEAFSAAEKKIKGRVTALSKYTSLVHDIYNAARSGKLKDKLFKGTGTVDSLVACYSAAVLAYDMKFLQSMERVFINMVYDISSQSKNYVAETKEPPKKENQEKKDNNPQPQGQNPDQGSGESDPNNPPTPPQI